MYHWWNLVPPPLEFSEMPTCCSASDSTCWALTLGSFPATASSGLPGAAGTVSALAEPQPVRAAVAAAQAATAQETKVLVARIIGVTPSASIPPTGLADGFGLGSRPTPGVTAWR